MIPFLFLFVGIKALVAGAVLFSGDSKTDKPPVRFLRLFGAVLVTLAGLFLTGAFFLAKFILEANF